MSSGENLWKLVENKENTDFTIIVKNGENPIKEFNVHKMIIKQNSPVFKAMFESGMKEATDSKVVIEDISPEYMKHALRHLYGCKLNKEINVIEIIKILQVADKYQINSLIEECSDYVLGNFMNIEWCATFLKNIHLFSNKLKEPCFQIIKQHTHAVLNDQKLLEISKDMLLEILDLEYFHLKNEVDIINFVERWAEAKFEKSNKKDEFSKDKSIRQILFANGCISKLRFLSLEKDECVKKFSTVGWLSSEERKHILNGFNHNVLPEEYPSYFSTSCQQRCNKIGALKFIPINVSVIELGETEFDVFVLATDCNFLFHTEEVGNKLLGIKIYGSFDDPTDDGREPIIEVKISNENGILIDKISSVFVKHYGYNQKSLYLHYPLLLERNRKYRVTVNFPSNEALHVPRQIIKPEISNKITILENGLLGAVTALIIQQQ